MTHLSHKASKLLKRAAEAQSDRYDDVKVLYDDGSAWYVSDAVYEAVSQDEVATELAEAAARSAYAEQAAEGADDDEARQAAFGAGDTLRQALHDRAETVADDEAKALLSDAEADAETEVAER